MLVRDATYSYSWVQTYLQLVPVKWVVNVKVLDLMGWKCFFGDEALTRQVSRVIRCADSSEAPSYYSPQVFRLKVSDFWLSVTHGWVFLKLNFRQGELKLEYIAKVYIFGSHFNFLSAFFFIFCKTASSGRGDFISSYLCFWQNSGGIFKAKLPSKA